MPAATSLTQLTASLLTELNEAVLESDSNQRAAYVALAAEAAVPVEVQEERAIGVSPTERLAAAERYVLDVLAPLLPRGGAANLVEKKTVMLDEASRAKIRAQFAGVFVDGRTIWDVLQSTITSPTPLGLTFDVLSPFIIEKLRLEVRTRHANVRAVLRAGLPKTAVHGGKLLFKVVLHEPANGGAALATLANEETIKTSADVVSALTLDFSVGAFPSLE